MSPDCTAPFKLATIDSQDGTTLELNSENDFDILPVQPIRNGEEIIYFTISRSGKRMIKTKRILNWSERIQKFSLEGKLREAIQLGLAFYNDQTVAGIGLGENPKQNSQHAILILLNKYLKKSLKYVKDDLNDVILRQIEYCDIADFVVAAVLNCDKACVLWEVDEIFKISIMDQFMASSDLGKEAFLESLNTHFQTGQLINISPILLTPFINYLYNKGELQKFSDYIKYISLAALDINLILKLFWSISYFKVDSYLFLINLRNLLFRV